MERLEAMRVFCEIVERGSLTAAANRLDLSLPMVTRALAALEKRVRVRLIERTTRRMRVTDAGRTFYEQAKRIVAAVAEAEGSIGEQRDQPTGTLHVSAPILFGRLQIAPLVSTYLERYPNVSVNLSLSDRFVDLIDEQVDVAIRIGRLPDSTLAAVPLGETQRVLVASPAYLRRAGRPKVPADLMRHAFLRMTALPQGSELRLLDDGQPLTVHTSGRFATNNGDVVIEAALRGEGIASAFAYQIIDLVHRSALALVLQQYAPAPVPIQAVFANPQLPPAKVRAFTEHVRSGLRGKRFVPDARAGSA
jgi:DNA-binding transcriptional LysR family regulator